MTGIRGPKMMPGGSSQESSAEKTGPRMHFQLDEVQAALLAWACVGPKGRGQERSDEARMAEGCNPPALTNLFDNSETGSGRR
jgi:hypothetical protein